MGLTSELECAALHLSGGNPFSDGPARLLKAANCQIDQFHCSVVGWKAPARFRGFADNAVQAFDGVGCIDDFAHLWRECKKWDHLLPGPPPAWGD